MAITISIDSDDAAALRLVCHAQGVTMSAYITKTLAPCLDADAEAALAVLARRGRRDGGRPGEP